MFQQMRSQYFTRSSRTRMTWQELYRQRHSGDSGGVVYDDLSWHLLVSTSRPGARVRDRQPVLGQSTIGIHHLRLRRCERSSTADCWSFGYTGSEKKAKRRRRKWKRGRRSVSFYLLRLVPQTFFIKTEEGKALSGYTIQMVHPGVLLAIKGAGDCAVLDAMKNHQKHTDEGILLSPAVDVSFRVMLRDDKETESIT